MSRINNKLGLLNAFTLFFGFYCIVNSFVIIAVCVVGPITSYTHLMNFVWSMAFGIVALSLLFWRLKRFSTFSKKLGIALIILAVLVQIFNIVNTIFMVLNL